MLPFSFLFCFCFCFLLSSFSTICFQNYDFIDYNWSFQFSSVKLFFAKFCLFSNKLATLFCFLALSRLARFSIDHARQGQANVENVASANRPSVLERKFVEFRDYERMDAVYALQRLRSNSKVRDQWTDEFLDQYVACMIFEVCWINVC